MFSRELWRKIKQKSGLENRWEGCDLHREVREDLADVTFDERSEEGHRAGAGGRETTRCKSWGRSMPGGGLTDEQGGQSPRVKGRIDEAAEGHRGQVIQVGWPLWGLCLFPARDGWPLEDSGKKWHDQHVSKGSLQLTKAGTPVERLLLSLLRGEVLVEWARRGVDEMWPGIWVSSGSRLGKIHWWAGCGQWNKLKKKSRLTPGFMAWTTRRLR